MATGSGIEHDDYLQQLSRAGTPSIALHDFIFQNFIIIDFISPTIKTTTKNALSVSGKVLLNAGIISILLVIFTKKGVKNLPPGL